MMVRHTKGKYIVHGTYDLETGALMGSRLEATEQK